MRERARATDCGPNGRVSTSSSPGCLFCQRMESRKELDERTVYEDEFFHVAHQTTEEERTVLGILLVQAIRHVSDLGSLTDAEAARLGTVISTVSRALQQCTGAAWTYCFGFTEAYRHVHLVVAARYPDLPSRYVRLALADWPQAPRGGRGKVAELCRRLRQAIGNRPGPRRAF